MNILLVMAHPDDAEIWCGGSIIRHTRSGDRVRVLVMTYFPDSQRGMEAQRGAELMGCEVELLGLSDTRVRPDEAVIDRLVDELVAFKPDLFITHWFDDVHPDHEATFQLARTAFFRRITREPLINPASFPLFLLCDSYRSLGLRGPFQPNHLVDVSKSWGDKLESIRAHKSQPVEFFSALVEKQCRDHGRQRGLEYAEGFILLDLFGLNRGLNSEQLF